MLKKSEQSLKSDVIASNPPPKIGVCALCRTEVEIFIGCVCKSCYDIKIVPYTKTTLKKKFVDRDPNADW